MNAIARHNKPLRLHWWKAVPNFGDAINPLIVGYMASRRVKHSGPKQAEIFAIGSMLQVVRRNYREAGTGQGPVIWGTGLLHPVNGTGFLDNVDVALLRGPVTAALLGVETTRFGDPGLLVNEAMPFEGKRAEKIGIVPHHSLVDDPDLSCLLAQDPVFELINPAGDPTEVCHQIAACSHVFASSLHGLIVADAYGVPNTWLEPKGQSRLKYHDYAASVGRYDMRVPVPLGDVPDAAKPDGPLAYADTIDECRDALRSTFPDHLKGA